MRYIYLILILTIQYAAFANSKDEPWVTQFRYTNGWGQFEVVWVTSDGNAGYANLGSSTTLPCQFKLSEADKEKIIASLNQTIRNPKTAPNFGSESFNCHDETRVLISVSLNAQNNGVIGFERRMSMMSQCNNFTVDSHLLSAATIAYGNIENLPSACEITPLKKR